VLIYLELRKFHPNTAETLHHNNSLINEHRSQCDSCTVSHIPRCRWWNHWSISVQQRNNLRTVWSYWLSEATGLSSRY